MDRALGRLLGMLPSVVRYPPGIVRNIQAWWEWCNRPAPANPPSPMRLSGQVRNGRITRVRKLGVSPSGRIVMSHPRPATRKTGFQEWRKAREAWERNDYIQHLNRLVAGIKRYEAQECLRDSLSNGIAQTSCDPETAAAASFEALQGLVTEQIEAERSMRTELDQLNAAADHIHEARNDDDDDVKRASHVYDEFMDDLRLYGDAKTAFQRIRYLVPRSEGDIETVKSRILLGESYADRVNFHRGWVPAEGYVNRLKEKEKRLLEHQRMVDAGQRHLDAQLRKLCKEGAPRAVRSISRTIRFDLTPEVLTSPTKGSGRLLQSQTRKAL